MSPRALDAITNFICNANANRYMTPGETGRAMYDFGSGAFTMSEEPTYDTATGGDFDYAL